MSANPEPRRWVWVLAMAVGWSTAIGVAFAQTTPVASRRAENDGVEQLAAKLIARERAVERGEKTLVEREGDLRAAEGRIDERLKELATLQSTLESKLAELDADDERRRADLVVMLEKMKPKEAAPVLAALEEPLAVDVIDRMNKAKAGKLLAAMPAPIAARLASKLTEPVELP